MSVRSAPTQTWSCRSIATVSYFLRSPLGVQLEEIWKTEIAPYLDELFFDRPAEAKSFSWEAVSGELLG